jgi:hypothetical protein
VFARPEDRRRLIRVEANARGPQTYRDLYHWSVGDRRTQFWDLMWQEAGLIYEGKYDEVRRFACVTPCAACPAPLSPFQYVGFVVHGF